MKDSKIKQMSNSAVLKFIGEYDNDDGCFIEPCEHGHLECSNSWRGPCIDEACSREWGMTWVNKSIEA